MDSGRNPGDAGLAIKRHPAIERHGTALATSTGLYACRIGRAFDNVTQSNLVFNKEARQPYAMNHRTILNGFLLNFIICCWDGAHRYLPLRGIQSKAGSLHLVAINVIDKLTLLSRTILRGRRSFHFWFRQFATKILTLSGGLITRLRHQSYPRQ